MNARAIAYASIFAIAGVTAWRILNLQRNPTAEAPVVAVERVWASSALALVISLATDLDPSLGAAFGGAIALGLLAGGDKPGGAFTGMITKLSQGKLLQSAASATPAAGSSSSSPAPPTSCPSGYTLLQGRCVPLAIN